MTLSQGAPGADPLPITIGLPEAAALEEAAVADDGTVVFASESDPVDVAVQAIDTGVRLQTVLADASAPARFDHPIDLPAGATIKVVGAAQAAAALEAAKTADAIASGEAPPPAEAIVPAEDADGQPTVVLFVGADGDLLGALAPAWAKDAAGQDVPTRYEVSGDVVTQVVEHADDSRVTYPVVADPYAGRTLFS
ncbi:hypothetical protein [Quadrisphaera sp. DSM 44207]|uniref:hypothetical protein n=1 Tax=Quadrisphaera sp. DSM 44207 TaxID=1881057 RepID=UPI000891E324|nr:hypothetical protein [Quadrisphaera sp. DSM 44207]SDQ38072.1 hypothetical protein SAMN05428996_1477 [Quadrisphaera sp. DSM 44207]